MTTIKKISHVDHVLQRPDMYIGAIGSVDRTDFFPGTDSMDLHRRTVTFNHCILKVFDEILVNARDHSVRDASVTTIRVQITDASFTVENDGSCVPFTFDETEGIYLPEMVFGHLLTSSNYDDEEERVVGGRNGLGAKLSNIMSSKFVVQLSDGTQTYKQIYTDNMKRIGKPAIRPNAAKMMGKSYTRITAFPDWSHVGATLIDADTKAAMVRRVIEVSATARPVVKLNNKAVTIKSIKQFAKALVGTTVPVVIHETPRWTVAIFAHDQAPRVGLVNGVWTPSGTHMQHILNQIVKHVRSTVKKIQLTPSMVSESLGMIVDATIVNPTFSNQQKDTLTTQASKFGSTCTLPNEVLKRVTSKGFGLVERLEALASSKADAAVSKLDASGLKRRLNIPKLDDATLAGTTRGAECTLILTEGDSAKSLAIAGLSVIGRNLYGVFPLRGKLVNVRDNDAASLKNAEIQYLKRIIGLEHRKKYTDASQLRYGRILIMTDADADGAHIKGLLLNFFDAQFPDLLAIPGFVAEFVTPIVKARKSDQTISFFSLQDYKTWAASTPNISAWSIKYYKGLGTSTSAEAREYFSRLDRHTITFTDDDGRQESLSLAFSKKRSDDRKRWIQGYDGTQRPYDVHTLSVSDFVNKDLVCFSTADVIRSIPSVMDGLKPSQRKVIFAALQRKMVSDVKVAQFAGYVAEKAAYHHGEVSLQSTIIGLARDFVGTNNVPLLVPSGQFGTRICGGSDAASARYIFTRLSPCTRTIFQARDDPVLAYLVDDGQRIEPEFYAPIIPMVLVNGASGIGTGWSSFVPCYNPLEIIDNLQCRLVGEAFKPLIPWYRGFSGRVHPTPNGFISVGTMTKSGKRVRVTELPVGVWTQPYKEWLLSNESICKVVDDSTETTVDISFECTVSAANEDDLKLVSKLSATNMVLFDPRGRVKRYDCITGILEDFYVARRALYDKRLAYELEESRKTRAILQNRLAFVSAVVDGRLTVVNRPEDDVVREMGHMGITECAALLEMPVRALTRSKIEQLQTLLREAHQKHDDLTKTTAAELWSADLQKLSHALSQ